MMITARKHDLAIAQFISASKNLAADMHVAQADPLRNVVVVHGDMNIVSKPPLLLHQPRRLFAE
eukprot:6717448-Pyramimonas_sp.AAC.1